MRNNIYTVDRLCRKILPLVYDESLSYLEMLGAITAKANELIANNDIIVDLANNLNKHIDDAIRDYLTEERLIEIIREELLPLRFMHNHRYIYVDALNGNDNWRGSNTFPVKTFDRALELGTITGWRNDNPADAGEWLDPSPDVRIVLKTAGNYTCTAVNWTSATVHLSTAADAGGRANLLIHKPNVTDAPNVQMYNTHFNATRINFQLDAGARMYWETAQITLNDCSLPNDTRFYGCHITLTDCILRGTISVYGGAGSITDAHIQNTTRGINVIDLISGADIVLKGDGWTAASPGGTETTGSLIHCDNATVRVEATAPTCSGYGALIWAFDSMMIFQGSAIFNGWNTGNIGHIARYDRANILLPANETAVLKSNMLRMQLAGVNHMEYFNSELQLWEPITYVRYYNGHLQYTAFTEDPDTHVKSVTWTNIPTE